ncbi:MAG: hypothetical protein ACM3TT_06645 [Syntrophothermus sp.]
MTIVVGLLLVLIVGGMIGIPLLRSEEAEAGELEAQELEGAEVPQMGSTSRDAVFKELNEIEFDYQMKKLSDDDYNLLKDRYTRMAVSILKEEEESEKQAMDEVEREIEAELAQAEADEATAQPVGGVAAGAIADPEAGFCIYCGAPLKMAGQAFCHQCGGKLGNQAG